MNMTLWSMVTAGLFVLAQAAFAGDSDGGIACNPDGVQIELNACARDEFESADAALNAAWKQLIAALEGDASSLKQTRAAQRAWLAFRDAEVAAHFPLQDGEDPNVMYGSMYPMSLHGVTTALTRQRTEQLRERLAELQAQ